MPPRPAHCVLALAILGAATLPAADATAADAAAAPAPADTNAAVPWAQAEPLVPPPTSDLWQVPPAKLLRHPDPAHDALFGKPAPALDLFAAGAACATCDWTPITHGDPAATGRFSTALDLLQRLAMHHAAWSAARHDPAAAVADLLATLRANRLRCGAHPALDDWTFASMREDWALSEADLLAPTLGPDACRAFATSYAALPPLPSLEDLIRQEQQTGLVRIAALLALPLAARPAAASGDPANPADPDLVSDAALTAARADIPQETARWIAYLRLPAAKRQHPLDPDLLTTDDNVDALLRSDPLVGAAPWNASAQAERVHAQFLAAIAWVADGPAGLAAHPDPVTGKPFIATPVPGGAILTCDTPDPRGHLPRLAIGDVTLPPRAPAPTATAPAPAPAPAHTDF
jgi:hypothetical protein